MRARSTLVLSSLALSLVLAACSGDDSNGRGGGGSPDASSSGSTSSGSSSGSGSGGTVIGQLDATVPEDAGNGASSSSGSSSGTSSSSSSSSGASDAGDAGDAGKIADGGGDGAAPSQVLVTTVGASVTATAVMINQGTAIGEGADNGATPVSLSNLADDGNNTQTVSSSNPFTATGTVPDTAAGFCDYPTDGGAPSRHSYVTGSKFEVIGDAGLGSDRMVTMAPYYFPLVYTTTNTATGNVILGSANPIIGLFDWRPKDIDEALVVAESDDMGQSWFFMQTVLELFPDYSNANSGGYVVGGANGCPAAITGTNANATSTNGANADDGWGHATILQLPGVGAGTGQFLYMLDRNTNDIPGTSTPVVDNAPLHVINLALASNKFPVWNTNHNGTPGANDIKSISTALTNSADAAAPVVVQDSVGLMNPDGIMAVFPTAADADAGTAVTVMYVQKIVGGDDTGTTALPIAEQCTKAPFSGKTNHDISNVRLATTTDGVSFTDLGVVSGLNDPTTVDYTKTRWISPRGTLLDIKGDGSVWGLYFSGGNCLDGDSDAFHYIGYAESTDKVHWTVYNGITNPIASINTITATNQAGGSSVTIPVTAPVFPTEFWFAERLYAPSAVQIDAKHLSMTFAGYGVQTPSADYLDYRQIGNVVLTVSESLPSGVPNNVNTH